MSWVGAAGGMWKLDWAGSWEDRNACTHANTCTHTPVFLGMKTQISSKLKHCNSSAGGEQARGNMPCRLCVIALWV